MYTVKTAQIESSVISLSAALNQIKVDKFMTF